MSIIAATRIASNCHQRLVATPHMPINPARKTETRAVEVLESHPHFKGRSRWVQARCSNGCLYLEGILPSYYLKQLAQEAVRKLAGIDRVVNQIKVASPVGEVGCCEQAVAISKSRSLALTSKPRLVVLG